MEIAVIGEGQEYSLYGLVIDGSCLISQFVSTMDETSLKQFAVLVREIQLNGLPKGKEKFRSLGDGIYELKIRNGVRFTCFFGGPQLEKSLILTHGFPKSKKNILQRDKERASNWRRQYMELPNIRQRIVELEVEP